MGKTPGVIEALSVISAPSQRRTDAHQNAGEVAKDKKKQNGDKKEGHGLLEPEAGDNMNFW
ncbi:hypothetical protein K6Q96_22760 [Grimontia kaedaensis]|uniref:Uncharacterized protein n=1 Tax=Grimontia kaedaensis TaxID=2872157 RepID=A0ABY4WZX2_9GAMM|nr:hypothetical protein [Grimontia kaedaensis]USH04548.1 hypothetical protein K6Q96_22760 [Grimontia kaedaensis]